MIAGLGPHVLRLALRYRGTPTRVMDPSNGLAYAPRVALARGLPEPDFVLIREDGWSLAGYDSNAGDCWRTWAGMWRQFARRRDGWELRPASEWDWQQ
jgi:hypothetical protein